MTLVDSSHLFFRKHTGLGNWYGIIRSSLSASLHTMGFFSKKSTRGKVLSALANTGNEETLATDTVHAMIAAAWSKAPRCFPEGPGWSWGVLLTTQANKEKYKWRQSQEFGLNFVAELWRFNPENVTWPLVCYPLPTRCFSWNIFTSQLELGSWKSFSLGNRESQGVHAIPARNCCNWLMLMIWSCFYLGNGRASCATCQQNHGAS